MKMTEKKKRGSYVFDGVFMIVAIINVKMSK